MIAKSELEEKLVSTETYHVKRIKSMMGKNKFGKAVCTFANGMSDYGKTGYVF